MYSPCACHSKCLVINYDHFEGKYLRITGDYLNTYCVIAGTRVIGDMGNTSREKLRMSYNSLPYVYIQRGNREHYGTFHHTGKIIWYNQTNLSYDKKPDVRREQFSSSIAPYN